MKKILSIFAFAAVIMIAQSCGTKKEETKEEQESVSVENEGATTSSTEERKARVKREREEYAERRRVAADERAKASASYKDATGKTVYYIVDVKPSFRGSDEQLESYVQENIKYPEAALQAQTEGTVFVEFVVGADGAVRDVEAVEATNEQAKNELSAEAIRVVSTMPAWQSGTQSGKPVDVRVSLPITFLID